jgi:hypothetical protein
MYDIAQDDDGRPVTLLYVGDYDPSGLYMSECDIPARLAKYGGNFIEIQRVALLPEHLDALPSFSAEDKKKDPRYKWFVQNHGARCWELDALDPNVLRGAVEQAIIGNIEDVAAWKRCEICEAAERESLQHVLSQWGAA